MVFSDLSTALRLRCCQQPWVPGPKNVTQPVGSIVPPSIRIGVQDSCGSVLELNCAVRDSLFRSVVGDNKC